MDDASDGGNQKPPKIKTPQHALRNMKILERASEGKSAKEIGDEFGIGRYQVSRILTSKEALTIVTNAQNRIYGLIDEAVSTVEDAMQSRSGDMNNGMKGALAVLESFGLIRKNINVQHNFPRSTIIRKRNGEEIVIGPKEEQIGQDHSDDNKTD